jgi:hypothetical protein
MPKDILINGASPMKMLIAASLLTQKNLTPASPKERSQATRVKRIFPYSKSLS